MEKTYSPNLVSFVNSLKRGQVRYIQNTHNIEYNLLLEETSFLPETFPLKFRVYYIKNNLHTPITCPICGTIITTWENHKKRFVTTCSYKCSANNPVRQEKQGSTNKDKYGVTNPFASTTIQEKIKNTNLKRFGVVNPSQNVEINNKKKQTYLKKFGMHPLSTPYVIDKRTETIKEKYGVDNISKSVPHKEKKKQTSIRNRGYEYNSQKTTHGLLHMLDNNDWLTEQHHILQKPITTIAKELNISSSTVAAYMQRKCIELMSFSHSTGEREISTFLTEINVSHIQNSKQVIPPLEIDIYIPDHNLAIEYCGLYWHCDKHERIDRQYHKRKLDLCNKQGIRLLTIFEDEWLYKQALVKEKILSILGKDQRHKIQARKCDVVNVSRTDKTKFFDTYHIQESGPGSLTIGLIFDNTLVACMSFIVQSNGEYILNRYATRCRVIGGFSKLLSHFKKNYDWKAIISFADLRWSCGNLYRTTGFELDKILPVDYEYVDITNTKRIHKFNFRHKNLPKILGSSYNPSLSEVQNTRSCGWYRIFNCGLQRWVLHNT